ncbi:MAG: Asp-tRNA(Asn)/Glu-tRNA(Gln) amidotransferase subunit GatB [Saprospiraceae bacterium]|nr:Asp-tRNA(Asn)/Glu-tRNA(Gln) amidotransferase subunit GatB [Saprospiraceae bacterium]
MDTIHKTQYETVIGLEAHVQLGTLSKAFCSDSAKFGGEPNTQTSVVSLAHPGTLPRINKKQIEYAVRLGLALGCRINECNAFDRKNYFYADLPKGYQITQDKHPICIGGSMPIRITEGVKSIRLHHIHMEEDAGKSIHDQNPTASLIDLNRSGTPLLEIVTEPDLRSGEEVDAFMSAMRHLVRWLDVSDGNMEEGSLRCDVNISIRPVGQKEFGTRCEVKNVNSMRFARKAIEFETKRQIEVVESGGKVEQNTLNFDPATGVTTPLRSKENAHDYRYFPDPDLPPVILTPAFLERIKNAMPQLPNEARAELMSTYGLPEYDALLLTEERAIFTYFKALASQKTTSREGGTGSQYKAVSNLMINKILPTANELKIELTEFPLSVTELTAFLHLIDAGKVSNSAAYQTLFPELMKQKARDLDAPLSVASVAEQLSLFQNSDTDFLTKIIAEVIGENAPKVGEYRKGKKGLLGFFVGEVMKRSKGKADPKVTNTLVVKALEG